jgi:LacI family transcriptional regulator
MYLLLFCVGHVDGVLLVRAGSEDDRQHIATLEESGIPIVTTGYYQPNLPSSMVDVDNVKGGYLATKHLIDNGHTQIAMITGPQGVKSTHDRTQGYLNALASAGITPVSDLIGYGNWHHSSGYQAMRDILGRDHPFTAVFSHNDRMAIGAISVLRQAELRVPEDVSIVGYDDIPEAEFSHPPLSTIHQPMIEVGREAARILIELIENPAAKPQQVCLDTELIPRASVNCRFIRILIKF